MKPAALGRCDRRRWVAAENDFLLAAPLPDRGNRHGEHSSARVYGCRARAKSSRTGATSTTVPSLVDLVHALIDPRIRLE